MFRGKARAAHLRPEHDGTAFAKLGKREYQALMAAGFTTIEKVRAASDMTLLRTKGLGQTKLRHIRAVIGRSLDEGEQWPASAASPRDLEIEHALALLRRIAVAVERLAERLAPRPTRLGARQAQGPRGPRSPGPRGSSRE